jgi:hypothetical protein
VNKEIVIEDDVNVASGVTFMDTDSHPRDAKERIADLPPRPEEIRPVRICKNAWIGNGSVILKGVTVGEGAIIGVNSVVVTDVPPYSVAMGNPARVIVKNINTAAPPGPQTPWASSLVLTNAVAMLKPASRRTIRAANWNTKGMWKIGATRNAMIKEARIAMMPTIKKMTSAEEATLLASLSLDSA